MATAIGRIDRRTAGPLAPDTFERILAGGSIVLLVAVVLALARGRADWGEVPVPVWVHLLTIGAALALTPMLLLGRRGDRRHRLLGRIWAGAMLVTALVSFDIRLIGDGQFSYIHILSAGMLVAVPLIWWSARTHRVALHRRVVRGTVTGALLTAGFFTFPFDRMLGHWLFG